jgi:hypothetical protein
MYISSSSVPWRNVFFFMSIWCKIHFLFTATESKNPYGIHFDYGNEDLFIVNFISLNVTFRYHSGLVLFNSTITIIFYFIDLFTSYMFFFSIGCNSCWPPHLLSPLEFEDFLHFHFEKFLLLIVTFDVGSSFQYVLLSY